MPQFLGKTVHEEEEAMTIYLCVMLISLIVAAAQNGVIGQQGKLPWYLPEDLRYFKSKTMGHCVVMGRKTYESIGRPLPGRINLLLSSGLLSASGFTTVSTPEAAVSFARSVGESELFVAGGAKVYEAFLPMADRVYLTEVEGDFAGDTFFALPSGWHKQAGDWQKSSTGLRFAFHVFSRA